MATFEKKFNECFKHTVIASRYVRKVENSIFDEKDDAIIELLKEVANTFYQHGVSDALGKTNISFDKMVEIRNMIYKPEL